MSPLQNEQDEPFDTEKAQAEVRIIMISSTILYYLLLIFVNIILQRGT